MDPQAKETSNCTSSASSLPPPPYPLPPPSEKIPMASSFFPSIHGRRRRELRCWRSLPGAVALLGCDQCCFNRWGEGGVPLDTDQQRVRRLQIGTPLSLSLSLFLSFSLFLLFLSPGLSVRHESQCLKQAGGVSLDQFHRHERIRVRIADRNLTGGVMFEAGFWLV